MGSATSIEDSLSDKIGYFFWNCWSAVSQISLIIAAIVIAFGYSLKLDGEILLMKTVHT